MEHQRISKRSGDSTNSTSESAENSDWQSRSQQEECYYMVRAVLDGRMIATIDGPIVLINGLQSHLRGSQLERLESLFRTRVEPVRLHLRRTNRPLGSISDAKSYSEMSQSV